MKKGAELHQQNQQKPFPTKHIFCAAYLLSLGHKIDHIDNIPGNKATMHFLGEGVEREVMSFFNGGAQKVDPKTFSDSYRHIKDMLFNNK